MSKRASERVTHWRRVAEVATFSHSGEARVGGWHTLSKHF